jgi:succinate dehydrogenase/fumarate reductase flavoprotein subunit
MSSARRAPVIVLDADQAWDHAADVAVVGTGIAGCSVAVARGCCPPGSAAVLSTAKHWETALFPAVFT